MAKASNLKPRFHSEALTDAPVSPRDLQAIYDCLCSLDKRMNEVITRFGQIYGDDSGKELQPFSENEMPRIHCMLHALSDQFGEIEDYVNRL